jgi:hypothetical protein
MGVAELWVQHLHRLNERLFVYVNFAFIGLSPLTEYLSENATHKGNLPPKAFGNFLCGNLNLRDVSISLTSWYALTRSLLEASGILVAGPHHIFVVPHIGTPRRGRVLGSSENRPR